MLLALFLRLDRPGSATGWSGCGSPARRRRRLSTSRRCERLRWSPQEMMIIAAAREIADGDVVFVGMRLPIVAFGVARLTHAPNAVGLFECGIVRAEPAATTLHTMGDPANQL